MNKELFDRAYQSYSKGDYQSALIGYTQCLQDPYNEPDRGEVGLIYHQIGNCLVKLKNPTEAIQAYTQAKNDSDYPAGSTVQCNLGMAYASLKDYENAVNCFEMALTDPNYDTPYKAHTGMGNALMKLGKSAEAGVAFREAALDETNPEPAKSLLNLGVCFMALNRPADAVASYESALQFNMKPEVRNKLNASLGQAYAACNQMERAVDAFEAAIADGSYFLSDSANVDYQRAVSAIAQAASEIDNADTSGLDISSEGLALFEDLDSPYFDDVAIEDPDEYPGYIGSAEEGEERFFNATEEEIEEWSKGLAKQDRKRRNVGLKILVALVIVVVLAFGAAVYLYVQGYGYPSQEQTIEQLFKNPSKEVFAPSVSETSVLSMTDCISKNATFKIDSTARTLTDSTVYVTATTAQKGTIYYKLTLVRNLIGWKISSVELYFPSQAG